MCFTSGLQNQSPKYDIWTSISQLTQLKEFHIGYLNVSEIPSNALRSPDGLSKLWRIGLSSANNLTISEEAFQNLTQLTNLDFFQNSFISFQKQSLKFNTKSNKHLSIYFHHCKFTSLAFDSGTFDGIQRPLKISFSNMTIDYLSESVFKSVLDNQNNSINFFPNGPNADSTIHCFNCKNHWLIKEGKENQVFNALCKEDQKKTLFHQQIKDKLNSKCKSNSF